jgi:uncharacterized glyoxalase superfamily protein PhnB
MSRQYLSPYINLARRAREAIEFYRKVLGGKLELHAMNEQGMSKRRARGTASRTRGSRPTVR